MSVGEDVLGTGTGTTKKEAEQAAAGQAVDALKKAALAKAANENVTCAL